MNKTPITIQVVSQLLISALAHRLSKKTEANALLAAMQQKKQKIFTFLANRAILRITMPATPLYDAHQGGFFYAC